MDTDKQMDVEGDAEPERVNIIVPEYNIHAQKTLNLYACQK